MPAFSSSLASLAISRRRAPVASSATMANTRSRPATSQRHPSESSTSDAATPGGAVVAGLAGAVLALSVSLGSPSPSSAEPTQPQTEVAQSTQQVMEGITPVYFGNGCFWGRQKDFVDTERTLGRSMNDVSAVVGYAGGRSGVNGRVCYYYAEPGTVYEGLGHAEVVQVGLNGSLEEREKQMQMFAQTYFSQFRKTPFGMIRQDPQDAGPGYRNVIGISGGINGPYMDIIRKENVNNMKLVEGKGNQYLQGQATEPDRINTVYVLDSDNMPFYRAEQYHQFHNGLGKAFPTQYTRDQRQAAAAAGRIDTTGCPEYPY